MTERERLLSAVCESPEDDAPRLVYADWLEEYGDEKEQARAEFIRVQVALSKFPEGDPARPPLVFRERALMDAHGEAWLAEVPAELGASVLRRGFIEHATLGAKQFIRLGASIWDSAPITSLLLQDADPRLPRSPHLARLSRLTLQPGMGFAPLLRSPRLAGLRSLAMSSLEAEQFHALGKQGWPEAIEELDLGGHLGDIPAMFRWPSRLAVLKASHCGIDAATAPGFATSLAGRPIRRLDLSHNELTPPGLAALLRVPGLPDGLEALDLQRCGLRLEAAQSLAECRALGRLRSLRLGQGWMGLRSLRLVAESPHLAGLEQLGMAFDYENIGDGGAELFAHRFPALRWLDLSSNRIGPETARAIADRAGGLWFLDLYSNGLADEGALALAWSPNLRGLQHLDLHANDIGTSAQAALLRSENARGLVFLRMSDDASKEVLEALADGTVSPYAEVRLGTARQTKARKAAEARFGKRLTFG